MKNIDVYPYVGDLDPKDNVTAGAYSNQELVGIHELLRMISRPVPNRGIAEQLRHTAKCLLLKVDNDAWIEVSPRLGSSDPSEKELASQANIIEFLLGEGEGEDD